MGSAVQLATMKVDLGSRNSIAHRLPYTPCEAQHVCRPVRGALGTRQTPRGATCELRTTLPSSEGTCRGPDSEPLPPCVLRGLALHRAVGRTLAKPPLVRQLTRM